MKSAKVLIGYLMALISGHADIAPILEQPLTDEAREYLLTMDLEWQVALLEHCFKLPPGKYRRV